MTGVAAHGAWCNARTFPSTCKHCHAQVFYFFCDCGSKVFFEVLGDPWTKHQCLEYKIATFGKANVEEALALGIVLPGYSKKGDEIEREYAEKVRKQREADKKKVREIVRMTAPPYASTQSDIGRVSELIPTVDVFKRAGLPSETQMAYALLRQLTKEPMGQITLLIDDISDNDKESYTCFVASNLLRKSGVLHGDIVEFTLSSVEVAILGHVWVCEALSSPLG
jgi:hypothetical protein